MLNAALPDESVVPVSATLEPGPPVRVTVAPGMRAPPAVTARTVNVTIGTGEPPSVIVNVLVLSAGYDVGTSCVNGAEYVPSAARRRAVYWRLGTIPSPAIVW